MPLHLSLQNTCYRRHHQFDLYVYFGIACVHTAHTEIESTNVLAKIFTNQKSSVLNHK